MTPWFPRAALLLSLISAPALAQEPSRISVVGEGTVSATPDRMTVDVGVQLVRSSSRDAMQAASARARNIIRALGRAGVAERDIQTRQIAVQPQYDYRDGRQTLRGYQATNLLTVNVRDLDNAGRILDAAVNAAEDEAIVYGVRFDVANDEQLLRRAREAAWRDALADAEHLARLARVELGRPLQIEERASPTQGPTVLRADLAESTPVQPGRVEVTVVLTVDFAVEGPGS